MTETRAQLVDTVLYWDAIADAAKARARAARTTLADRALAEWEAEGTAPTWRTEMATVPMAVSKPAVTVEDEAAWTVWVADRHPTEVQQVTRVREAWQADYLAKLAAAGDDQLCTADGEEIPGLRYVPGGQPAGIRIVPAKGVKSALAEVAETVLEGLAPVGGAQ